ncbi:hypothetical protein A343_1505 [Porphyromonas gingivalis JCVI SC001]|nr:hypothetical protein A343_1505 [Porphyromonas gingivalis JCVI SC001]
MLRIKPRHSPCAIRENPKEVFTLLRLSSLQAFYLMEA